jgi:hypothetical protein
MTDVTPCHVEFEIPDPDRFERLACVFAALKHDKDADSFRADEAWRALFDERALARLAWDFDSLIDAFKNGEYRLVACRRVSERLARLEYDPLAWPFGGTECMRELLETFEARVVGEG